MRISSYKKIYKRKFHKEHKTEVEKKAFWINRSDGPNAFFLQKHIKTYPNRTLGYI